jgi:hypothetical protein
MTAPAGCGWSPRRTADHDRILRTSRVATSSRPGCAAATERKIHRSPSTAMQTTDDPSGAVATVSTPHGPSYLAVRPSQHFAVPPGAGNRVHSQSDVSATAKTQGQALELVSAARDPNARLLGHRNDEWSAIDDCQRLVTSAERTFVVAGETWWAFYRSVPETEPSSRYGV